MGTMRAMALTAVGRPLEPVTMPRPVAGPGQVLLRVGACGVCRTDLHLRAGEVEVPTLPRVLGHQIVGTDVTTGRRIGVAWMAWTCGECRWCLGGRENLCPRACFTGRDVDGGMAEYAVADIRHCHLIPDGYSDVEAAPLLCAGMIGSRSLAMCGDARRIGIYGFGAAAHIVCQIARWEGREVYAFTRTGDAAAQSFARGLGAVWAGGSDDEPPEPLGAAIVFAPDGALVPRALRAVEPGGVVVCGGIHMSDIPSFPYSDLWHERTIRSVANLTRDDAMRLLEVAPRVPVRTEVTTYALEDADRALDDLAAGRVTGAVVLEVR